MSAKVLGLAAAAGALGGYYIYSEYAGCTYKGQEDLSGDVFIFTGSTNPGVGKETAKGIAQRGGTVLLGGKNMDRCHQARQHIIHSTNYTNRDIECHELDLKSIKSIRKFVDDLPADLKIRGLINTAETVKKTEREETRDGLEKQMGVSHFGHFLLINLLAEKYKKAEPWRILSTTYSAASKGTINFADLNSEHAYHPSIVYRQAKLATLLTTYEAARRFKGTSVTVHAVNPGLSNTEAFRHSSGNQPFIMKVLSQPVLMFIFASPVKVAQSVLYAALSPDLEGVTGKYIQNCQVKDIPVNFQRETDTAAQLWNLSQQVVSDPAKYVALQTSSK